MTTAESLERSDYFGVRVAPGFKQNVRELAALMSVRLGTRVGIAQALEIAVREAIEAQKKESVECEK